ncbi:hypothetical protein J6590_065756 [Homalodisca vitripennis]|nr:hypothetical protein J6590_065756 [Homalodisca vitripennis]
MPSVNVPSSRWTIDSSDKKDQRHRGVSKSVRAFLSAHPTAPCRETCLLCRLLHFSFCRRCRSGTFAIKAVERGKALLRLLFTFRLVQCLNTVLETRLLESEVVHELFRLQRHLDHKVPHSLSCTTNFRRCADRKVKREGAKHSICLLTLLLKPPHIEHLPSTGRMLCLGRPRGTTLHRKRPSSGRTDEFVCTYSFS